MANKNIKWLLLLLLIVAVYFWMHQSKQQAAQPVPSTTPAAVVPSEQESDLTEQPGGNTHTTAINQPDLNKQPHPLSPAPASSAAPGTNVDQAANPMANDQPKAIAPANPIPTPEQTMAALSVQNTRREARDRVLSDRVTQIDAVHKAILAQGEKNTAKEDKTNPPPLLTPPAEIAEKLKSHQLTAH